MIFATKMSAPPGAVFWKAESEPARSPALVMYPVTYRIPDGSIFTAVTASAPAAPIRVEYVSTGSMVRGNDRS